MILKTPRLILRPLSMQDALTLFKISKDKNIQLYTKLGKQNSIKKLKNYLGNELKLQKQNKAMHFTIISESAKQIIGLISLKNLDQYNKRASIKYLLDKKFRNKGYTKEACKIIIKFAFNKLKLNRIELNCAATNIASKKLINNLDAKYEGTQRKRIKIKNEFIDRLQYSILKKEYQPN